MVCCGLLRASFDELLRVGAIGASPGYACRETPSPGRGERLCAVSFAPTGLSSRGRRTRASISANLDTSAPRGRGTRSFIFGSLKMSKLLSVLIERRYRLNFNCSIIGGLSWQLRLQEI